MERLLNRPPDLGDRDALPPLWHWLFRPTVTRQDERGSDGHVRRGALIPPIDLPQRMWASGTVRFHDAIEIGQEATRRSVVESVDLKDGRHGPLCFVTLQHDLATHSRRRITEEQTLVYRQIGEPAEPAEPPAETPTWYRVVTPDATMLAEYSALTGNGHRIHIDRGYATSVEQYPSLVVHGPLLATWLAGLAHDELAGPMVSFSFRAVAPTFDGEVVRLAGRPTGEGAELWAASSRGVHMRATARLA